MNLNKPAAKIILLAVIALALILFSWSQPAPRSAMQLSFDEWLTKEEALLNDIASHSPAENGESLKLAKQGPILSLQIVPEPPALATNMKLEVSRDPQQAANILRLLQLMREADIFSIGERAGVRATDIPRVSLSVSGSSQSFTTHFQATHVKGNAPFELMLKLFDEYSRLPKQERKDT